MAGPESVTDVNPELARTREELEFRLRLGEEGGNLAAEAMSAISLLEYADPAIDSERGPMAIKDIRLENTLGGSQAAIARLREQAALAANGYEGSRVTKGFIAQNRQLIAKLLHEADAIQNLLDFAQTNNQLPLKERRPLTEEMAQPVREAIERLRQQALDIFAVLKAREEAKPEAGDDPDEAIKKGPIIAPPGCVVVAKFIMPPGADKQQIPLERQSATSSGHWNEIGFNDEFYSSSEQVPPEQVALALDAAGQMVFIADSVRLASSALETDMVRYAGPTVHAYQRDGQVRAWHGLGYTELSIEPAEVVATTYPEPFEGTMQV